MRVTEDPSDFERNFLDYILNTALPTYRISIQSSYTKG